MTGSRIAAAAAALGIGIGLAAGAVSSTSRLFERAAPEVLIPLEPVVALHRTSMLVAAQRAETLLAEGRPWDAWRMLQPFLEEGEAPASVSLLAARAAAGWEHWEGVRSLLSGEGWVARDGDALLLLATAEDRLGRHRGAAAAFRSYLALPGRADAAVTQVRLARSLARAGDHAAASEAFRSAAAALPAASDWLTVLAVRARLDGEAPDTAWAVERVPPASAAARVALSQAAAATWVAAGLPERAAERLARDARILAQQGAAEEAAELVVAGTRLPLDEARRAEMRDMLRATALEPSLPAALRLRAAQRLGELAEPGTAAEELARAAAYEAARRPGLAARSLRAALGQGAPDDAAARLRLARLLFEAGEFGEARRIALEVGSAGGEERTAAGAELIAARARFRGGDRAGGVAELRRLVERRPESAEAGTALFLLADAAPTVRDALPLYRRAGAIHAAPEAREALERLGERSVRSGDHAGATRAWEELVRRYPDGEATGELALSVGLLHRRAGRAEAARAMFAASIAADPVSYPAVRAGELLGVDPIASILAEPRPWIGLASDPGEGAAVLARLDILQVAGLDAEWRAELDGAVRRLASRPTALLALAEGLRDRGHVVDGIRIGRRLLAVRGGEWDGRLLRLVFPLPFRSLLEAESERHGVDPMLFAALIRQESNFRPDARSRVGATGLSQVMPSTGRWIAPRVGIAPAEFSERLLGVPEINLGMGALYLGDLMRRYGGARDLALAGYNAGPGRADRWRREFGHAADPDGFRDAIPFAETRHYVRVVLRNAAVYERLYGRPVPPVPASAE